MSLRQLAGFLRVTSQLMRDFLPKRVSQFTRSPTGLGPRSPVLVNVPRPAPAAFPVVVLAKASARRASCHFTDYDN